jgi:hypothetical protein
MLTRLGAVVETGHLRVKPVAQDDQVRGDAVVIFDFDGRSALGREPGGFDNRSGGRAERVTCAPGNGRAAFDDNETHRLVDG